MTILKSIFITFFLILITTTLALPMLAFRSDSPAYIYIVGLSQIIPNLFTYSLMIIYLRYSRINYSLISGKAKRNTVLLIFIIIALAIGDHLFDLPFFAWKELSNHYFGTLFVLNDYSDYVFDPVQFYPGFSALFIAPVFEELFFRYYIFGGLLKRYNLMTAMLTSSILFSLIHFDSPRNIIPTFIFGLISTTIYFRTKKIQYSMFLHFVANVFWFATVLFAKQYDALTQQVGFGLFFWLLFFAGALILAIGLKKMPVTDAAMPVE